MTHSFSSSNVLGLQNLELDSFMSHKKLNMINKWSWITPKWHILSKRYVVITFYSYCLINETKQQWQKIMVGHCFEKLSGFAVHRGIRKPSEKQMKAQGRRETAFIASRCQDTPMKSSHSFLIYYLKYSKLASSRFRTASSISLPNWFEKICQHSCTMHVFRDDWSRYHCNWQGKWQDHAITKFA